MPATPEGRGSGRASSEAPATDRLAARPVGPAAVSPAVRQALLEAFDPRQIAMARKAANVATLATNAYRANLTLRSCERLVSQSKILSQRKFLLEQQSVKSKQSTKKQRPASTVQPAEVLAAFAFAFTS